VKLDSIAIRWITALPRMASPLAGPGRMQGAHSSRSCIAAAIPRTLFTRALRTWQIHPQESERKRSDLLCGIPEMLVSSHLIGSRCCNRPPGRFVTFN